VKAEKYLEYERQWEEYGKKQVEYFERRRKLVEEDASEKKFKDLKKEFGYEGLSSSWFGPYTIIDDPKDLIDPNFILPGYGIPFCKMENTDHKIPEYFGKRIRSEIENTEGVVIAYGYDAGDDYIIIKTDDGRVVNVIVNSKYQLCL